MKGDLGLVPEYRMKNNPYMEDPGFDYDPPDERAAGRPHELGWWETLMNEYENDATLNDMKPGRIIYEDETE